MAQRSLFPTSGVLDIAPGRMGWFCFFLSELSGRPHLLSPHTSGFETEPLPFMQISHSVVWPSLTCPVGLRRSTLPGEPSSNWESLGKSEGDPKRKGEKRSSVESYTEDQECSSFAFGNIENGFMANSQEVLTIRSVLAHFAKDRKHFCECGWFFQ